MNLVQVSERLFVPSWRELVAIGLTAIAIRIALCLVTLYLAPMTIDGFAAIRDGEQYIAFAQAWLGDFSNLDEYSQRFFPLYPILTAILHLLGVPLPVSGLVINWTGVGFVAVLSAWLFQDRRVGWAMAVLTPSYLLNSVLFSTETTSLVFVLLALISGRSERFLLAGIAFGLAGLTRPTSLFPAIGFFAWMWQNSRLRGGLLTSLVAVVVAMLGFAAVHWRFGDALMSFRVYATNDQAYGGQFLTWPFASLINTPLERHVPLWKIAYVWFHVLLTLVASVWMIVHLRRPESRHGRGFEWCVAIWLWCNTLFILSLGSRWGFDEYHRKVVPSLPALFWSLRALLPHGKASWLWVPVALVSVLMGLEALSHNFAEGRQFVPPAASQPASLP